MTKNLADKGPIKQKQIHDIVLLSLQVVYEECINFYCCVINYHKLSGLKQCKFIFLHFLQGRSLSMVQMGSMSRFLQGGNQGYNQVSVTLSLPSQCSLPSSLRLLGESVPFSCRFVPIFLLTVDQGTLLAPGSHLQFLISVFFFPSQQEHVSLTLNL